MSAQVSPLEQLEQQTTQGQAAQPASSPSSLSPLEQLEQKAPSQSSADSQATVAVPDAGRIPGVMSFGNKVTPSQAATGVAAGAAAGAAPLAVSALPEIVQAAGSIGKWVKENPLSTIALSKVADELGVHPLDLIHKVSKYGKGLVGN